MPGLSKALALAAAFAGACAEAAAAPPSRALAAAPAPAPQRTQPRFDILEYRVLGNHVLPTTSVERAVYPFLGPNGDLDAVKKAADSLEKAYKDAGYGTIFVDIPEQAVDEGVVRLKVTEGTLEHARVRGARYFSGRQILAALPALQQGATPYLPALQQQLAALNARSADRSVTPVLKAGSEPGTVDVDLAVKDALPLHGFVAVDDRHTADTTPNRVTAGLSYDNLWQRQDSVSLMYQTAPADPSNATVDSATYVAHAGASGGLASISYTHTSSNVLALGTLGVLGKGDIYGAHWMQPLESTATTSRSFTFGLDYKDVLTQVLPDATTSGASTAAVLAPVRYVNWTAAYSQAWRYAHSSYTMSFGVGFGIQGIVNQEPEFESSRYDASPAYLYLRWSGEATQGLPLGLALLERFTSQWSANPLVNNEQFSLGGLDTVRGYLEAETLGDSGIAGTFELHSPTLPAHLGLLRLPVYAFGFVDAGVATLLDPLPAQDYKLRLWSTGGGLRIDNTSGVAGEVDYAIAEATGLRTRQGQGRVDFTLRYGF
ncbi:MAG: ShlB/FhaC/HecB family hemolysin secretion/activation protein [Steroidobacteraceae bacterium]